MRAFHRLRPAGCWSIGFVVMHLLCLPTSGPCRSLLPPEKSGARNKDGEGRGNKIRPGDGLKEMNLRSGDLGKDLSCP